MRTINRTTTVAELVLEHPRAARVFRKHHIDFCCGGRRSLVDACEEKGVSLDTLLAELDAQAPDPVATASLLNLPTRKLLAHIIERHHGYLRKSLPWIHGMAAKVARVHGTHDARLLDLDATVRVLSDALLAHLDTEEEVLFPLLLDRKADPDIRTLQLDMMDSEHQEVGIALERIRTLTDDFAVPEWGCATMRALFAELHTMEADIHQHVHLENNVVMPRFRNH